MKTPPGSSRKSIAGGAGAAILWMGLGLALWRAAAIPGGEVLLDPDRWLGARQPGLWILATGVLFLAVLLLRRAGVSRRAALVLGTGLAVVLAVATSSTLIATGKCGEAFGRSVAWLDDDMMISLRYARNCAAGAGLVWNPGERVEGYTNLLWTLLQVPFHWVAAPESVARWTLGLNVCLLAALIVATAGLAARLGASPWSAGFAALGLATCTPVLHWTGAGGEAVLAALLLVLVALRVPIAGGRGAALLGGLAVLTRPDAFVAALVLLGPDRWQRDARRAAARRWLWFALLPVLQVLFRRLYYGTWLPNTYFLKATGWDGRQLAGLAYVLDFLSRYGLLCAVAFLALLAPGRGRILAACVAHLAAVVWMGGDELPELRFFVPVFPLLYVLAFCGAGDLARRIGGETEAPEPAARPLTPLALPALLLAAQGLGIALLPGSVPARLARRSDGELANVMVGLLLRENTAPDARVAHFWAGAATYFSDRPALDLLGKCDPHVAHLEGRPGLFAPGHNKYDLAYSLALEPDVVVSGMGSFAGPDHPLVQEYRSGDYRAFAELYDEPAFQGQYLGNAVGVRPDAPQEIRNVSGRWHGIFVRRGSPRARPPEEWSIPGLE